MAGLLNSSIGAPAQSTSQGPLSDPTLQKIEAGVEAKLAPGIRSLYTSCVNAGMQAMFGPQTGPRVMAKLKSSANVTNDITAGVANIFATIFNQIASKMNPQQKQAFLPALIAASTTLTCHALDTAEKLGKLQVTADLAAITIHNASMACLQKLGIGPAQIQQLQQQKGAAAQPAPSGQAAAQPGAQS